MHSLTRRSIRSRVIVAATPVLLLAIILPAVLRDSSPRSTPASSAIYADALGSGWDNWSWDSTIDLNNGAPVHGGSASIAVTYNAAWAGLYLHTDITVNLSSYNTLRFFIHGGSTGGQPLHVVANGDVADTFAVTATANVWTQIDVPLTALGNPATLNDLFWQDTSGGAQPTFYLDDIQLIGNVLPPTPIPPGAGPALSVDAQSDVHPISPYIYGMNFADENLAAELHLPVRRWGGNSATRYDWQNDTSNTGNDWYFENVPEDNPNPGQLPNGSAADRFVEQDRRTGTKTIMTMPLIGWTAKRRPSTHPYDCGFSVAQFGAQQSTDWQFDPDCGNGRLANGTPITTNSPLSTSMAITTTFVVSWVNHLIGNYGTAANGGVKFYSLDNEPMLWNDTHRDVHPQPTTYDELRDRTYLYAAAIKATDPGAQTLGPVLWGWCAYFFSAADHCSPTGSDYQAHGNTAFAAWYLQQMQAYEQAHGTRILDYLDLHVYPQAAGVALSPAGNAATQALRLRSTRALWDPTYVDESWIGQAGWEGGIVRVIPRMRDWVAANYPGTKLAITEYNWGGLEHINGAVAQADVLGIFGREGLDLATMWDPPTSAQPAAYAFRMYLNYDGMQHTFGDVSVHAASADQDQVAVYAAKRSSDNALTVMIINKSLTQTLTSALSLANFDPALSAQVYRYSVSNLTAIGQLPDQAVGPFGFTAAFPAQSITLFIIPQGVPLDQHVYLPVLMKN